MWVEHRNNILSRLRPTSCPADSVHANHSPADRHQSASKPFLSYVAAPAMSVLLCLRKQANISASHARTQNACSWEILNCLLLLGHAQHTHGFRNHLCHSSVRHNLLACSQNVSRKSATTRHTMGAAPPST